MTGVFQAAYGQLLGDQPCICVLVPLISAVYTSTKGVQVQKVYSCMQGDMEGVRQQAEQHLAAAHAEARSTIQKAQATAADLQVSNFAHLCRAACIDFWMCVCVCVCVCGQYAHLAVAVVNHVCLLSTSCCGFLIWYLAFIWLVVFHLVFWVG